MKKKAATKRKDKTIIQKSPKNWNKEDDQIVINEGKNG